MKYILFFLAIHCKKTKETSGLGRVRALNLTVPLGSGQMILGMGRVRVSV